LTAHETLHANRVALDLLDLKAFVERIAARDPDRQAVEIQTRVAHIIRFNARIYL